MSQASPGAAGARDRTDVPIDRQYKMLLYHVPQHTVRCGNLPKEGFKSITLSETTYKKFYNSYREKKEQLHSKGVKSFSGYVTSRLEESMQRDKTLADHAPRLQEISVTEDQIIIKDNIKNRIAEIVFQNGKLYCYLCEEADCIHIGFAFSIPAVYEKMDGRSIRNPRM